MDNDEGRCAAGPWISVEDALPEEGMTCLAQFSDGSFDVCIAASIAKFVQWANNHEVSVYITHWAEVRV